VLQQSGKQASDIKAVVGAGGGFGSPHVDDVLE
jgi:hypothetical protein